MYLFEADLKSEVEFILQTSTFLLINISLFKNLYILLTTIRRIAFFLIKMTYFGLKSFIKYE